MYDTSMGVLRVCSGIHGEARLGESPHLIQLRLGKPGLFTLGPLTLTHCTIRYSTSVLRVVHSEGAVENSRSVLHHIRTIVDYIN